MPTMPTKLYRTKKRQRCPRMRDKHAGQAAAHRNQHGKKTPFENQVDFDLVCSTKALAQKVSSKVKETAPGNPK